MKKLLFIILLVVLTLPVRILAEDPVLRWKPVKYSGGYIVEIKNSSNKVVIKKQTNKNYFKVDLKPGKYKFKLTTLNKFGKPEASTKWIVFYVKKVAFPTIESISTDKIYIDTDNTVKIIGQNLTSKTKLYLVKNGKKTEIKNFQVDGNKIIFKLNPSEEMIGAYKILLVNPGEKQFESDNSVIAIVQKNIPYIDKVVPGRIYIEEGKTTISIKGRNFTNDTLIIIPEIDDDVKINYVSENEIEIVVKNNAFSKGKYSIKSQNNSNETFMMENAFSVLDPEDGMFGYGKLQISIGYYTMFPVADWNAHLKNSYKGFNFNVEYPFSNFVYIGKYFSNVYLKNIGMESSFSGQFIESEDIEKNYDFESSLWNLSLGINYRYDFGMPVEFGFHTGTGLSFNSIDSQDGTSRVFTASIIYIGTSVRYVFQYFYFIETGLYFKDIIYDTHSLLSVDATFKVGIIL